MIDTYTRLLEVVAESASEEAADHAMTKLVNHLKSVGQIRMLTKILRELRRIDARRKALAPVVEVARKSERAAALRAAARGGIAANVARINASLIRGWRARGGGALLDRSAKGALVELYRRVTV